MENLLEVLNDTFEENRVLALGLLTSHPLKHAIESKVSTLSNRSFSSGHGMTNTKSATRTI